MVANIDFSLIKAQIFIFMSVVCFVCIVVLGVNGWYSTAKTELDEMQSALNNASQKLTHRVEGNTIYRQLHSQFKFLHGFSFAKPDKLRWMEKIQAQGEALSLPSMTYNIKARELDQRFGSQLSEHAVFKTQIELQAGLVHGVQLLHVIDGLKKSGLGMFSVEQCALSQNRSKFQVAMPNVMAQCIIEWYEIDQNDMDDFATGDML